MTTRGRYVPDRTVHRNRLLAAVVLAAITGSASALELASNDLTDLSLEELLAIDVVTVSKAAEPASRAPAAVYVITHDDILRSGARSIPEALRLAPGVNVAQVNADDYAVSIRGFNAVLADKLEVLIDGRSVYTPLFSGVFWDVLDVALTDIDRIEVVRGPGATLWGANAVNGVINIITRSARETTGTVSVVEVGTERNAATLRSGQRVGSDSALRLYGKAVERGDGRLGDGRDATDRQRIAMAGGRLDTALSVDDQLSVSGNLYTADADSPGGDVSTNGGDANIHYVRPLGEGDDAAQLSLRATYSGFRRDQPTYREKRDTYDIQLQYSRTIGQRHEFIGGVGYRHSSDETGGPPYPAIFLPADRDIEQPSAFLQDRIDLIDDRLTLTLGSKFEHNDFTGYEVQPGARLGYAASERTYLWSSVAKAVRTPNRVDHDVALYCPPPDGFPGFCDGGEIIRVGNPDFDSETLIAYEIGARRQFGEWLSVDVAGFYNDYDDLRSTEPVLLGASFENRLSGVGTGGEVAVIIKPADWVELRAWYAYLDIDIDASDSADASTAAVHEGSSPRHQALFSALWARGRWQVQGIVRYVDELQAGGIDAYTDLNLRVAYEWLDGAEIGLIGTNLLDDHHAEFASDSETVEAERAVSLELRWNWGDDP